MSNRFKPKEANELYSKLQEFADFRRGKLMPMLEPYVGITDRYGRLLSRICLIVGESEPASIQDSVIRDLMADVFDFLYESRFLILKGNTLVAFPLARRAYESLSLLHLCLLDNRIAEQWASGKKFSNQDIRKGLDAHPIGEKEEGLKTLYNFYCGMTHPNREMIAFRGLGEGNSYVFGSVQIPNLVEVTEFCIKDIDLWFWFGATISLYYKKQWFQRDPSYRETYKKTAEDAKKVKKWLIQQYDKVLNEWHNEKNVVLPKYAIPDPAQDTSQTNKLKH